MSARSLPPGPVVALLNRAIAEKGISRACSSDDLTHFAGISARTYWRWKAGRPADINAVERVCDHLGLHPLEVYGSEWCEVPA